MSILPVIDDLCREAGIGASAATDSSTPPVLDDFSRHYYGLKGRAIPFDPAIIESIKSGEIKTELSIARWDADFADAPFLYALLMRLDILGAAGVRVYFMKEARSSVSCRLGGT